MSQTLGVGFVVRFLQSWFIIIIVNAILECKLWYYKAKVIHLWSVKCQMIFFLKREEPCWQALGRRQRAEPRGKARCCGAARRALGEEASQPGSAPREVVLSHGSLSVCDSSQLLPLWWPCLGMFTFGCVLSLVPVVWIAHYCITGYGSTDASELFFETNSSRNTVV